MTRNRDLDEATFHRIARNREVARQTRDARRAQRLRQAEAAAADEGPTPERFKHADVIEVEETIKAGVKVQRVRTENLLDRYLLQGVIDEDRHTAGMMLYADFRVTEANSSLAGHYGPKQIDARQRASEAGLEAQHNLTRALQAVGIILSSVLVHVCLCNQPVKDWARARGNRERDGAAALRLALGALCDHYRRSRRSA